MYIEQGSAFGYLNGNTWRMKLNKLRIRNFRRLQNVEIDFSDVTFLVGANNSAKSTTFAAIELLLTQKKFTSEDRTRFVNSEGIEQTVTEETSIEGEFIDVSTDILKDRGFDEGRLFRYSKPDGTDGFGFNYRVRYDPNGNKTIREIELHAIDIKEEFRGCTTPNDFIELGVKPKYFEGKALSRKIKSQEIAKLCDEIPGVSQANQERKWFENPGGFAANVLSRLPLFLCIEAGALPEELTAKGKSMQTLLSELFAGVRDQSNYYKQAREALENLAKELDPADEGQEFGNMMKELNLVIKEVFPGSFIEITPSLSGPEVLNPTFQIDMKSNIKTSIAYQGTGMIRSVVFSLLRFYKKRSCNETTRDLFICFEEPELFLHPNAATSMREAIYSLGGGKTQIACSTHSPYMIDLAQQTSQSLNRYTIGERGYSKVFSFKHSETLSKMMEDDKTRVKLLQKIDDYVARVFFARKVILIEGNTEEIVFKNTISAMPEEVRKRIRDEFQIIKANGKATMISFIKYLKAMNIDLFVVHDKDSKTEGAAKMNPKILESLGDKTDDRYMMEDCIEDVLGYPAPSQDKPFRAYEHTKEWSEWKDIPKKWKDVVKIIFSEFADQL